MATLRERCYRIDVRSWEYRRDLLFRPILSRHATIAANKNRAIIERMRNDINRSAFGDLILFVDNRTVGRVINVLPY